METTTDIDLYEAALLRYARECEADGTIYEQPAESRSGVEHNTGQRTGTDVVLRNMNGILAVYRVHDDGTLESTYMEYVERP